MRDDPTSRLPDGHKLVCRVKNAAGGYWLAQDAKGYEYVLGACVEHSGDVVRVTHRDADGYQTQWTGHGADWQRTDSQGAVDAYRGRNAAARGLSPWTLPTGLPPTETDALRHLRQLARKLADRTAQAGAWLHGKPGSGKTMAAHWIALHCAQHRMHVCHRSTADLARIMRASYSREPGAIATWQRLQAECEAADLLILDDVGAEGGGDDLRAELLRIVDLRQNAGQYIVATSNYTTTAAVDPPPHGCGMDPRLASRFGRLAALDMGQIDHRRRT